jgi:uncharacterized alkaline shock family protein YloU
VTANLASEAPTTRLPVEARGVTEIAETVVERIAARSAGEVNGVRAVPLSSIRRLLRPGREQAADAAIATNSVSVKVHVSVEYPRPIPLVADEVRRRVQQQIGQLTGMRVDDITITVDALPSQHRPHRRRVS